MFLTGPGVVREALGEEVDAAGARRPAGPRPKRRLSPRRARRAARRGSGPRARSPTCPRRPARPAPLADSIEPEHSDPGAAVPLERRARLRRARGARRDRRPRTRCSSSARAGPATSSPRWPGSRAGRWRSWPTSRAIWAACSTPTGSEKAARFVGFCDSFGVPLLAVVDTPGFMPGSRQEQAGVIRHGASLVRAFASARVPKLTVVLRKSYGGAYITMNSRDLGADLVLAWPRGRARDHERPGGGGDRQPARAARWRRTRTRERERLADAYAEEHLRAEAAAAGGLRRRDHRARARPAPARRRAATPSAAGRSLA